MLACRARALIDGRYAPSLDDVVALAEPVLQHRMALGFAARADGLTVRDVIAELKAADRIGAARWRVTGSRRRGAADRGEGHRRRRCPTC